MENLELNAVLVEQLLGLNSLVTAMTKEVVEKEGLNESQANLLWLIDPQADPVPLRELALRLQCDPSNVTLLSAKLEEKGLAKRAPHPQDGRVRTLVLTRAGKRSRDRLLAGAYARSPFTALGDREQQQLHRLLAKVLESRTTARAAG
ncbi:MarR family transcriptional regulator [Streptomyces sp. SID13031]|uniref:MarR family winged helix-turn-helix transcriptional regulator n=1 Tax=Streptomyces sp. SID13031 TaxID=2706046 RepID=UPI0013C5BC1C|nr:MarR family transcriptional regulator [Streptomyces sp. SID13031]NEA36737.1 MarR family transcriptional regulator [Streptomyces sp. SID13031]